MTVRGVILALGTLLAAQATARAEPGKPERLDVVGFSGDGDKLLVSAGSDAYLLSASDGSTKAFVMWKTERSICQTRMQELAAAVTANDIQGVAMHADLCGDPANGRLVEIAKGAPKRQAVWFDWSRDPKHPSRDQLRSGALAFKLQKGALVLWDGRRRQVALIGAPEWDRLGKLTALLGPKRRFLVVFRQDGDWGHLLSRIFYSPDGNLKSLRPFSTP